MHCNWRQCKKQLVKSQSLIAWTRAPFAAAMIAPKTKVSNKQPSIWLISEHNASAATEHTRAAQRRAKQSQIKAQARHCKAQNCKYLLAVVACRTLAARTQASRAPIKGHSTGDESKSQSALIVWTDLLDKHTMTTTARTQKHCNCAATANARSKQLQTALI